MKLIKKLGLFVVTGAMALGVGLSLNAKSVSETNATEEVVYYTADYSKAAAITEGEFTTSYADEEAVTLTDGTYAKEWKSYGANPNSYAVAGTRFGGKNAGLLTSGVTNAPAAITTGDDWYAMYIAGTDQFGQEVTKVEVTSIGTFGTATVVVGKKMILQVSANADFSSSAEYETTMVASGTHTFTAPTSWPSTSYYRVVMERSTSTKNSGIIISNLKFYANLTVKDVTDVTIGVPESTTLNIGDALELSAVVLPADATDKSLTWSSDDPSVLEVDSNGKVTAISSGSTVISAASVQKPAIIDYLELTVIGTPSSYDKTFTATDFGMIGTYVDGNYTDDGIVYYAYQVMKSTNATTLNALQFRGSPSGFIYNKTAFVNNIKSITIRLSSGNTDTAYALYVGSAANPGNTNTITGTADEDIPSIITFDVSGAGNFKFFKFLRTATSGTVYVDAIAVEMVETNVEDARTYANSFLTTLDAECAALSVSSTTWSTLSDSYGLLSAAAKTAFTGETSAVAATKIQRALERYVYIVNKYGYTNFMGITVGGASTTSFDISRSSSVSTIVLIAIAGFTAIGGMFFLKRKREE